MPRRVAFYVRVSTTDQHTEPPLHALRAYAEARGLEIAAEYVVHGVSGARDRRPALDGSWPTPDAGASMPLPSSNSIGSAAPVTTF
jgi:Resolvase, N terminal domain